MIFPFLQGIRGFEKVPLTWMLVAFNVMLYVVLLPQQFLLQQRMEAHLADPVMQEIHGRVYTSYLGSRNPEQLNSLQTELLKRDAQGKNVNSQAVRMALQDSEFLEATESIAAMGDKVAFARWQNWIREFRQDNALRPMSNYGISYFDHSGFNMITYQYIHANAMHLFTNMLVLLIFGSVLEPVLGSLAFLLIYTIGGVAGAFAFIQFNGLGVAPLVGGSAAISSLMAFYAMVEHRKRVSFAYLLGPIRGYYGLIYLPTWMILPLCFLSDIASILQSGTGFGGIAYAAHLGGGVMGLLLAVGFKPLLLFSRSKSAA